jgi:hypothetical protein
MSPIVCLRWLPRIVAPTRYRGSRARDKLRQGNSKIGKSGHLSPEGMGSAERCNEKAALKAWLFG